MTILDWSTFVLQRRINQPLAAVELVLVDPRVLAAGAAIRLAGGSVLTLDRSFGVTFPPFGLDGASWCAPASVRNRHGRALVRCELEINAWAPGSTELIVRPRGGHPLRWGPRRLRRYFVITHAAADALAQVLAVRAAPFAAPDRGPAVYVR